VRTVDDGLRRRRLRQSPSATAERRGAERRSQRARLWALPARRIVCRSDALDEDDLVADEEAARVLAVSAGRLKGGLAKVAQLAAYDPGATLGGRGGATAQARAVLAGLWDQAPAVSGSACGNERCSASSIPAREIARAAHASSCLPARSAATPTTAPRRGQGPVPRRRRALRADLRRHRVRPKLFGSEIGRSLTTRRWSRSARGARGDYRAGGDALAGSLPLDRHPALRSRGRIPERSSPGS
jgi:hypothetical protein